MKRNTFLILCLYLILFSTFSCSNEGNDVDPNQTRFGIFTVLSNETTITMDGDIGSSSLNDFNDLLNNYPNVNRIEIIECEGSSDDEINLQLSFKVFQRGMEIHLTNDGLIASGGVDFFLAGTRRTIGTETLIGVHAWSYVEDDGSITSATEFPVGHENHLPYIDYYMDIGFSQQEAEDFYYFTINAAAPEDIHWMSEEEISQYNVLKE